MLKSRKITKLYELKKGSGADVESHGTGFYGVTEFKALLEDARRKGITIIPELGAPGHSKAAITGKFQKIKIIQKS